MKARAPPTTNGTPLLLQQWCATQLPERSPWHVVGQRTGGIRIRGCDRENCGHRGGRSQVKVEARPLHTFAQSRGNNAWPRSARTAKSKGRREKSGVKGPLLLAPGRMGTQIRAGLVAVVDSTRPSSSTVPGIRSLWTLEHYVQLNSTRIRLRSSEAICG